MFSKLYYCSSHCSNTSASNIRKLQGVQNFAARIVSGRRKFDHVSPALKDLRWIPVNVPINVNPVGGGGGGGNAGKGWGFDKF